MFEDNPNYYPTTNELIERMLEKIDLRMCLYVLEPSAGSGHIIDYCKEYYKKRYNRYMNYNTPVEKYIKFDAVEIDNRLAAILKDKNINVVWDDFLSYQPQRFYNLIIANYPFSNGCEHLLHSIEIQERIGGKIVCLINADTLRNPYSNNRKHLLKLLEQYNAEIEYIENAFTDSERKTDVTVALIYIDIPMQDKTTMFEREFKRDNPDIQFDDIKSLMPTMSKLESLVFECDMIKKAGIELFKEKMKIDKLLNGMNLSSKITICNDLCNPKVISVNSFIDDTNLEFWNKFITETDFKNRLPSKLRDTFTCNMEKQRDIAFNMENVRYFYTELMKAIPQSYEETVAKVFDDVTRKYTYTDSTWNQTIRYYTGWKTNNCMKIHKRVIIPCSRYYSYSLPSELIDLNIIFENISGVKDNLNKDNRVREAIERCEKKIETEHFIIDSYKKGTIHIFFKNEEHLQKFNWLAAKGKNWLPGDFGTKSYSDMDEEEKLLLSEFGLSPEQYNKYANQKDYLRLMA